MRHPEPDRLHALLVGSDPLARSGLGAALSAELDILAALHPDDFQMDSPIALAADAVVWDLGVEGVDRLPEGITVPTLALVMTADEARLVLHSGAKGVLKRAVEPIRIATAVGALSVGLVVIDEAFSAILPTAPARLIEPLSPREREVLILLADGLSNQQIARRLFISTHTAKFHVGTILGKLGVSSRTAAVVAAVRLGLLEL